MSIIQQHSNLTLSDNWRTINIDALDPESSLNFDISTLHPALPDVSDAEIRQLGQQIRQLLRGGDAEGALRGALDTAPVGASDAVKELHLQTVIEILQSIKASEMTPILQRIYGSEGGPDALDTLMKYLYKGMSASQGQGNPRPSRTATASSTGGFTQMAGRNFSSGDSLGSSMSVLLSWHEKVVEVAGLGAIGRVMTDRRKV